MISPKDLYFSMLDKERNIYELAQLFPQTRKPISEYINILKEPKTDKEVIVKDEKNNWSPNL
jgi:hypothetical protein